MVSSSKKGPTVPYVSDHFSEENSSIIPTYNHGLFDKAPTRAFFKAARKGKKKKKIVSAAAATVFETEINGGFVKPPQHQ
jgi:cobyric acid synthase